MTLTLLLLKEMANLHLVESFPSEGMLSRGIWMQTVITDALLWSTTDGLKF